MNIGDMINNVLHSETTLYDLLALVIFRLNFYFKLLNHDSECVLAIGHFKQNSEEFYLWQ